MSSRSPEPCSGRSHLTPSPSGTLPDLRTSSPRPSCALRGLRPEGDRIMGSASRRHGSLAEASIGHPPGLVLPHPTHPSAGEEPHFLFGKSWACTHPLAPVTRDAEVAHTCRTGHTLTTHTDPLRTSPGSPAAYPDPKTPSRCSVSTYNKKEEGSRKGTWEGTHT